MKRHERLQRAARSRDRSPPAHKQLPGEHDFVDGISTIFKNHIAELRAQEKNLRSTIIATRLAIEEIRNSQPETLAMWRQISVKETEIKSLTGRLDGIPVRIAGLWQPTEHTLRAQYASMYAIPRLQTIVVADERIVLLTDPLFGRDHAGAWHRIGPFRASFCALYPCLSTIRWTNLEGPKGKFEGPPNILTYSDGLGNVSCPGDDAKRIVGDAGMKRDYPTLASFVIRYPECAGSISSKAIYGWPKVDPNDLPSWYIEQFGK